MAQTQPSITTGGPEYAERVAEVIAAAFSSSVLTAYLLRTPESTWPTDNISQEIVGPHFKKSVSKRAEMGAELVEAGGFAAVAVWFPPGIPISYGTVTDPRMLEYLDIFIPMREKYLKGRDYWYLNLIGRHPDRTEPGAVRALVDPYMKKAREQGAPLWLEAISDHARDVYEHLGFRVVAEVRVGVGRANSRGEFAEDGEGMVVYGMMAE